MLLVYDLETKSGNSWKDHYSGKSGIACVCVLDADTGMPFVFMDDNMNELTNLLKEASGVITWNGNSFDDKVLEAHGIGVGKSPRCDLMKVCQRASGYRKGWTLDNTSRLNLSREKSTESFAPDLYQANKFGELLRYCFMDVWLTLALFRKANVQGYLIGPKGTQVPMNPSSSFRESSNTISDLVSGLRFGGTRF